MDTYRTLEPENCDFVDIAAVEDLPAGERLFLEIDGRPIVVFNIAGQYFAIADECSHEELPLGEGEVDAESLTITCPYHGADFDLQTGRALSLPAVQDIPAYPVRLRAGRLEIGLPRDGQK